MRLLLLSCLVWVFKVVCCSLKLLQTLFRIPAFISSEMFWPQLINTSVALSLLEMTSSILQAADFLFWCCLLSYYFISSTTRPVWWSIALLAPSPLRRTRHLCHPIDTTLRIKAPLWSLCCSLKPEQLTGGEESQQHSPCPLLCLLPLAPSCWSARRQQLTSACGGSLPTDTSKALCSLDLLGKELSVSWKRRK